MEERFGFIRDKLDIKILILFILRRLPAPIDGDSLAELAICEDSISYFDYTECLTELLDSGHITLSEAGYAITDKGRANGIITENSLPYTVRLSVEKALGPIARNQRRDELIETSHVSRGRGYDAVLSLSDDVGPVMSIRLYCANEPTAERVEGIFRKKAEEVVSALMDLLTTDEEG